MRVFLSNVHARRINEPPRFESSLQFHVLFIWKFAPPPPPLFDVECELTRPATLCCCSRYLRISARQNQQSSTALHASARKVISAIIQAAPSSLPPPRYATNCCTAAAAAAKQGVRCIRIIRDTRNTMLLNTCHLRGGGKPNTSGGDRERRIVGHRLARRLHKLPLIDADSISECLGNCCSHSARLQCIRSAATGIALGRYLR